MQSYGKFIRFRYFVPDILDLLVGSQIRLIVTILNTIAVFDGKGTKKSATALTRFTDFFVPLQAK